MFFVILNVFTFSTNNNLFADGAPGHPFYDYFTQTPLTLVQIQNFYPGKDTKGWYATPQGAGASLYGNISRYNSQFNWGYTITQSSIATLHILSDNIVKMKLSDVAVYFPQGLENSYVDKTSGAIIFYPLESKDLSREVWCHLEKGVPYPLFMTDCGNLVRPTSSGGSAKNSTTTTASNGNGGTVVNVNNYITTTATGGSSTATATATAPATMPSSDQSTPGWSSWGQVQQPPQQYSQYPPQYPSQPQIVYPRHDWYDILSLFFQGATAAGVWYDVYKDGQSGYAVIPSGCQNCQPQWHPHPHGGHGAGGPGPDIPNGDPGSTGGPGPDISNGLLSNPGSSWGQQ